MPATSDRSNDHSHEGGPGRLLWLLPTLTFVAGALLGGVLVALGAIPFADTLDDSPAAPQSPEATDGATAPGAGPSREPSDDTTVIVPNECVQAAETSLRILARVRDAAGAIGDLDARQLQRIVDDLQALQPKIIRLVTGCRSAAADANLGADSR